MPTKTPWKVHAREVADEPGSDVVFWVLRISAGRGRKSMRLDIRLQDTAGGETIAEEALIGREDKLFELAAQAGQE